MRQSTGVVSLNDGDYDNLLQLYPPQQLHHDDRARSSKVKPLPGLKENYLPPINNAGHSPASGLDLLSVLISAIYCKQILDESKWSENSSNVDQFGGESQPYATLLGEGKVAWPSSSVVSHMKMVLKLIFGVRLQGNEE
ncbi:unnamed protein product [Sphagnum balticum]